MEAISTGNTSCHGREINISCSFGAVVGYFYNPSSPLNESDNSINIFLNNSSFTTNVNIYHPNDTCYTTDFHSAKKNSNGSICSIGNYFQSINFCYQC